MQLFCQALVIINVFQHMYLQNMYLYRTITSFYYYISALKKLISLKLLLYVFQ